jgi:hypothetical protein
MGWTTRAGPTALEAPGSCLSESTNKVSVGFPLLVANPGWIRQAKVPLRDAAGLPDCSRSVAAQRKPPERIAQWNYTPRARGDRTGSGSPFMPLGSGCVSLRRAQLVKPKCTNAARPDDGVEMPLGRLASSVRLRDGSVQELGSLGKTALLERMACWSRTSHPAIPQATRFRGSGQNQVERPSYPDQDATA